MKNLLTLHKKECSPEFTVFKWRKCIEERHYPCWSNKLNGQKKQNSQSPAVQPRICTRELKERKHSAKATTEKNTEQYSLHNQYKNFRCCFIETKTFSITNVA